MDSSRVLSLLLETTLAGSVAVLLVLALRRPLRRGFGARVGYGAWLLVPAMLLAVLVPVGPAADAVLPDAGTPVARIVASAAAVPPATPSWWLAAWMAGAAASLLWLACAQSRFRHGLGRLRHRGPVLLAGAGHAGLPATCGLLRPRIVLPTDFVARHGRWQRRLVLAHERAHLAHGDLQVNAAAALLRCLFWFNPLFQLAAMALRQDQELACDGRVLARHPHARRAYGDALLRAQLATWPSPLACHFGFGHPLKERIAMLGQPLPSAARRRSGIALVATFAAACAFAAWAGQPAEVQATADREVGIVSLPAPAYPEGLAKQGVSGVVQLLVEVGADGTVTSAKVKHARPAGVFDTAALAAAKRWRFQPALRDGKPVAARVVVPVRFEPDREPQG